MDRLKSNLKFKFKQQKPLCFEKILWFSNLDRFSEQNGTTMQTNCIKSLQIDYNGLTAISGRYIVYLLNYII